MTAVVTVAKPVAKATRTFIGRAWKNKTQDGREYLNIKLDKLDQDKNPIMLNGVDFNCTLQLWPNPKREGKKDADLRLSILVPVATA